MEYMPMFISTLILFIFLSTYCLVNYFMNYLIHPYAYGVLILLLLYYCCCHITVTTDKLHQVSYFLGVADLTNQLLRLINILWLPLCRINKFGFYFARRLL